MVITFTNIQTTSSGGGSGEVQQYYGGRYIDITGNVISVTGVSSTQEVEEMIADVEEQIPSVEGLATEQYVDDKVKDLQVYQSGDYIDITGNIISATGLTTPEYVQEEIKASGDEMKGYVDNTLSGYSTTEQVQGMITSAQTETQEWVEGKGYLTEQSLSGYSTTEQVQGMITSAQTETEAKIPSIEGLATEDYVDNAVSGKVDTTVLEGYYTSGQTDEAINEAVSGIPRTFKTVNNESVVGEGDIDTNQIVELTQEEYDALEEKDENILYIITDADYLTFKTINNQSILGEGNIVIDGYQAGDNIYIANDVISATGLTTPEQVQEMITSAQTETEAKIPSIEGLATEEWVEDKGYMYVATAEATFVNKTVLLDYYTSGQTDEAINEAVSGIPTTFKTINGQDIIGEGNIVIESEGGGGAVYIAGDNIDITDNVISVTGLPTTVEVESMITSAQTETEAKIPSVEGLASEEYVNNSISGLPTTVEVESMISSATTEVENKIPSLTGYATEEWVEDKGYLTEHQSLSAYSTTEQVQEMITSAQTETEAKIPSLTGYATEEWVEGKGYLTEHQSLSAYSTTEQVQGMITSAQTETEAKIPSLTGYATEEWVEDKGYLTEHQSLSGYSTTEQVQGMITSAQTETEAKIPSIEGLASEEYVNNSISGLPTTVEVESMISSATTEVENKIPSLSGYATEDYVNNAVSGKVDTTVLESYYTSGQTDEAINEAVSGIPTTFKTVNGQTITGEGNIVIEGGSGTGGETVVELTQEEYDALTEYAENTTYIITNTEAINMADYYTKTEVDTIVDNINLSDYYTKTEIDTMIGNINNILETI